eukprot:symbB.v1.2.013405.t1/scaffold950.1/size149601/8
MGGGETIAASSEISTILEANEVTIAARHLTSHRPKNPQVQSSERFHLTTWWPCVETLPGCKLCAKMAGYLDIQCDPSKEVHRRIIHIKAGGFTTVNVIDGSSTPPDGLFVQLDQEGVCSLRFSPDGLFFAFLDKSRKLGSVQTMQPKQVLWPSCKWSSKADFEVLGYFWLPGGPQDCNSDLAMVSTHGIEIFRLSFEQRLGRFDLVLTRGHSIEPADVALVTIYDSSYCIHADGLTGKVSLRNVTNLEQGTPEHDIVIDVSDSDAPVGPLRLSVVDNLLIVHCLERMTALVFDIRHKDRDVVPSLIAPSAVTSKDEAGTSVSSSWISWDYLDGGIVLDATKGMVYQLRLDPGIILDDFLSRPPHELPTVLKLLLRRTGCRDHIVQLLRKGLVSKTNSAEMAQGFQVLNSAYRQVIEALSQKSGTRQTTVSLQELEAQIAYQSVLSEKDMVTLVFHPHFVTSEGLEEVIPEDLGNDSFALEHWSIPHDLRQAPEKGQVNQGGKTPYVLSVVILYLRSLLGLQILPHKILQCFVFDLCVYFRQEHLLQQLLHYHVLLDSPELALRLKAVAVNRGSWATQASLDMALRVREFSVVAEMLLFSGQYLDIVPFIVTQKDVNFKVKTLLEDLEKDVKANAEDPELMQHVLTEIRLWKQEADLSPCAGEGGEVPQPDLEGCEKWLPELIKASTFSS